jgi:porin
MTRFVIAFFSWMVCGLCVARIGAVSFAQESGGADRTLPTDAAPIEGKEQPFDLWSAKTLTGDWGGGRSALEEAGVRFKIKLMNQYMVNMRGGLETKNGQDTAGSYEVNMYLDFDKMGLFPGGELFIRGKGTWGGDDSDFDKEKIGGFFKTNQDASSEEAIFVDKWWWTKRLFSNRVELRFGRMEPVKDLFDTSKIIGHEDKYFLNRALVRNATIPPDKGLGLFLNWDVTDAVYVRVAAIDAHSRDRQPNFDTAFHDEDEFRYYGEFGVRPNLPSAKGEMWGHYRLGTWYDASPNQQHVNTLGGRRAERFQTGDWGFYLGFDQMIWKENDNAGDAQGLAVAGRYGRARGELNRIEHFWSLAVQYEGPFESRDKDLLGVGMAQGIFADEYRRIAPRADRETVYEAYYAYHVSPWLVVSPHVQFITNAGGKRGDDNAAVFALRFKMAL